MRNKRTVLYLFAMGLALSGCLVSGEEGAENESFFQEAIAHNGHDYLFVTTPKTWAEAQVYCATYNNFGGYHLVVVNSLAEETFLNNKESQYWLNNWWIGYTDSGIEGNWTPVYSSTVVSNWAPGQPDNLNDQDCAVDGSNGSGAWNDDQCTALHPFVCERETTASGQDGSFTYNRSQTYDATVNTKAVAVTLYAGQLFTMGTCGLPGATGTGDTFLRLKNPSGVEIAFNDDSCGLLSNISVVISTTGTHTIHAGCFDVEACSGTLVYNY